jgi:hypothetical protein
MEGAGEAGNNRPGAAIGRKMTMAETPNYPVSVKNPGLDDAPEPILWKDRKRFLGMPISFTRYKVDANRFYTKIGLLRTVTNEVLLYRILDVKLTRNLGQKLFGVGTITLYSADQSDDRIILKNIAKSEKVRRFLSSMVENERNKRRIAGRELYGSAIPGLMDTDGDGLPD